MSFFKTAKGTNLPVITLKGKDYLEVKYRLVWFREEKPAWSIETTILETSDRASMARAVIRDETGRVIATGHKSETVQGFADHMEKSETGAIGRALALCGYGTQFCADELDEGQRIVDAPVSIARPIMPDKPTSNDGNLEPTHYKIPFGKWAQRTLEEVHRNHGSDAIWDYVEYIEDSAKKKSKPVTGDAAEFISRVKDFMRVVDGVVLT